MFREFHLRSNFLFAITAEPESSCWTTRKLFAFPTLLASWIRRLPQNRPLPQQVCSIFVHSTSPVSACFRKCRIRCNSATVQALG